MSLPLTLLHICMPRSIPTIFRVGDNVVVQVPGKQEMYYGVITHMHSMFCSLLTIQISKKCINHACEEYTAEFRITEMFPTIVRKT